MEDLETAKVRETKGDIGGLCPGTLLAFNKQLQTWAFSFRMEALGF